MLPYPHPPAACRSVNSSSNFGQEPTQSNKLTTNVPTVAITQDAIATLTEGKNDQKQVHDLLKSCHLLREELTNSSVLFWNVLAAILEGHMMVS